MATFGPPFVNTSNLADGAVTSAKIALDTIAAVDVAANAIGDSEIAAHTTTKITSPFSLITGTVPIAQGGTGGVAKEAAFDALSPVTTQGDIIYRNGTVNTRLAIGASGLFLKSNGAGQNPSWAAVSGTFTNGVATKNLADASTTQTIAHGISGTPVKIVLMGVGPVDPPIISFGSYDASGQSSSWKDGFSVSGNDATAAIVFVTNAGTPAKQVGVVSVDATNITITWTKSNSPTGTCHFHWQAFA